MKETAAPDSRPDEQPTLVFFDGVCALCHGTVRFLMARSRREHFRFIPLHLVHGTAWEQAIRDELGLDLTTSIVIAKHGRLESRSRAIFTILSDLGLPWSLANVARIIPIAIWDQLYNFVARIRYRVFGQSALENFCAPLPPDLRRLLLDKVPPR